MWEQALVWWDITVDFLGRPEVRAFTTIIAIASAAAGLWAAMKAQRVLHTHQQQILVTQQQSLNEQWQRINAAVLTNDRALQTKSSVIGSDNVEHVRHLTLFETLVNLLFQAWASKDRGTLSEEIYNKHFVSVAYYFRNSADLFSFVALESEYPKNFVDNCKRRFGELKPLTKAEMSEWIRDFASRLNQAGIEAKDLP